MGVDGEEWFNHTRLDANRNIFADKHGVCH